MTTKSGARNSKEDKKRLADIKAHAMGIHAMAAEMEPDPEDPSEPAEDAVGEKSIKAANLPEQAMSTGKALDDLRCVKALGNNRLGGYACLWGNEKSKDLEDEWFTPQTGETTDIFNAMGKLPYLYNHATDGVIKTVVIGNVDVLQVDDLGIWYETQLDTANKYIAAIRKLVAAKALGTSSGTLPGARRVAKSGEILRWPIVEISATPTPCDPRQVTDRPVAELKSLYKSIGLEFPESTEGTGSEKLRQTEVQKKLKFLDILELEVGVYL